MRKKQKGKIYPEYYRNCIPEEECTNLKFYSTKNIRFTWIFCNESGKDYFFTTHLLPFLGENPKNPVFSFLSKYKTLTTGISR